MHRNRVKLIYGYVRNIDYAHPQAKPLGLNKRLAVVLLPGVHAQIDCYFDYEFFLTIYRALAECVQHDRADFKLHEYGQHSVELRSIDELREFYVGAPITARDPIAHARLVDGKKTRCLIDMEYHPEQQATRPTPEPYANAYAYAFYFAEADEQRIQRQCLLACRSYGAEIEEIEALPAPQISIWTRLYHFIVSDPPEAPPE